MRTRKPGESDRTRRYDLRKVLPINGTGAGRGARSLLGCECAEWAEAGVDEAEADASAGVWAERGKAESGDGGGMERSCIALCPRRVAGMTSDP